MARSERDTIGSYLSGIAHASPVPVEVVLAPEVRSLRAAWRAGLAKARGEFVALVGPGVVVTDAWLDQLVALAGANPAIGLVAPMNNAAAGPQRAADVTYADPSESLDAFAQRWSTPGGSRASAWSSSPVSWTRRAPPPRGRPVSDSEPRRVPTSNAGSRRLGPASRASTRLRSGSDRGVAD